MAEKFPEATCGEAERIGILPAGVVAAFIEDSGVEVATGALPVNVVAIFEVDRRAESSAIVGVSLDLERDSV